MEFQLSHTILRPNGRLLSHSSRLLSHYRTKSTKIIKFRTIPAQNTKNYPNRPNNQKVTAVSKKCKKNRFFFFTLGHQLQVLKRCPDNPETPYKQ